MRGDGGWGRLRTQVLRKLKLNFNHKECLPARMRESGGGTTREVGRRRGGGDAELEVRAAIVISH